MKSNLLPVMFAVIGLMAGCTALDQFPETREMNEGTLKAIDAEYFKIVTSIYEEPDENVRISIRNRFIETRLAIVDAQFQDFVVALAAENAQSSLAIDLAGIGVGGAGSLASGGTSKVLSAISAGLTGGQAAYDKSALHDKALLALVAQMHASRQAIAAEIYQRWSLDTIKYPLWIARQDIEAYQFAGSLPGAISATASDAQDKAQEAKVITFGKVTAEAATEQAFEERKTLREQVNALSAVQAKKLVERISVEFPSSKALIDVNYAEEIRAADEDGSKAKGLLRRLIILTAKEDADRKNWRSLIGETSE